MLIHSLSADELRFRVATVGPLRFLKENSNFPKNAVDNIVSATEESTKVATLLTRKAKRHEKAELLMLRCEKNMSKRNYLSKIRNVRLIVMKIYEDFLTQRRSRGLYLGSHMSSVVSVPNQTLKLKLSKWMMSQIM